MPDLSALQLKQEAVEIDFDTYVDPSEFPVPIPEGVFNFKQGKPKFDAKDGFLVAIMDHTVSQPGDPHDGSKITFDRISNKPFERQGVRVNMMTDQLRSLGNTSRPRTHEEYAQAIEAGEGQLFKGQVQWEAFCDHRDTPQATNGSQNFSLKGMKKFQLLPNGEYNPETKCPTCGKDIQARARINRRIPAG